MLDERVVGPAQQPAGVGDAAAAEERKVFADPVEVLAGTAGVEADLEAAEWRARERRGGGGRRVGGNKADRPGLHIDRPGLD